MGEISDRNSTVRNKYSKLFSLFLIILAYGATILNHQPIKLL